jgi:hypothetical protein
MTQVTVPYRSPSGQPSPSQPTRRALLAGAAAACDNGYQMTTDPHPAWWAGREATKSASLPRCVLRCPGSRRPSSASIPAASRAIPLMLHARQVDYGPRAARPLDSVNETDGWY